jgi:hypothetical protein
VPSSKVKNVSAVVVTKGVQHIQAQVGIVYQLSSEAFDIQKLNLIAKKVDNDLEVALDDSVIIFDNYFDVCAIDLSCLVSLPTENGGLYYVVTDTFFTLSSPLLLEAATTATVNNAATISIFEATMS